MNRMLAEILGKEIGYCHGRGGSMHIADVQLNIVGPTASSAAECPSPWAWRSCVYRKTDAVVVCFFGDAAANIGAFHESLNMSAVMKLPVVWVCENNQYGLSTCICRTLAGESIGAGRRLWHVGLDDLTAITWWRWSRRPGGDRPGRDGRGPSRSRRSPTAGTATGPRTTARTAPRKKRPVGGKCPIKSYTAMLLKQGVLDEARLKEMTEEADAEVREAIRFATEAQPPDPESGASTSLAKGKGLGALWCGRPACPENAGGTPALKMQAGRPHHNGRPNGDKVRF